VLAARGYTEEVNRVDSENPYIVYIKGELRILLNYDSDEEALLLAWAEGRTVKAPKAYWDGVPGPVLVPNWQYIYYEEACRPMPISSPEVAALRNRVTFWLERHLEDNNF
jgi:hypothetical protein